VCHLSNLSLLSFSETSVEHISSLLHQQSESSTVRAKIIGGGAGGGSPTEVPKVDLSKRDDIVVIYNRVPKTGSTSFINVAYDLCKQNSFHVVHVNISSNMHTLSLPNQVRILNQRLITSIHCLNPNSSTVIIFSG